MKSSINLFDQDQPALKPVHEYSEFIVDYPENTVDITVYYNSGEFTIKVAFQKFHDEQLRQAIKEPVDEFTRVHKGHLFDRRLEEKMKAYLKDVFVHSKIPFTSYKWEFADWKTMYDHLD